MSGALRIKIFAKHRSLQLEQTEIAIDSGTIYQSYIAEQY